MITLMFFTMLLGVIVIGSLYVAAAVIAIYGIFVLITLFRKFILHHIIGKVCKIILIVGGVIAAVAGSWMGLVYLVVEICSGN